MRELVDLWSILPDGPARKNGFWRGFDAAAPGEFMIWSEYIEGGAVTLRLLPGPRSTKALDETRAAVAKLRGSV